MDGLDAIRALTNGEWQRAVKWARRHDVEVPGSPSDMEKMHSYAHDARYAYPKRMALVQNIAEHMRSTDPDEGIVSGRLEALAETFRKRANRAKENERYSEMDIWIDAETDTKRLIPDEGTNE